MKKLHFVLFASLFLAGCGGGGGGASVVAEWLGTDPNAVVTTPTGKTYDLTHGVPDPNGNLFANSVTNGKFFADGPFMVFSHQFCGATCSSGPSFEAPHPDAAAAWRQGWTGASRNILIADVISVSAGLPPNLDQDEHSLTTSSLASIIAPGSTIHGIYGEVSTDSSSIVKVIDKSGSTSIFSSADISAPLNAMRQMPGYYFDAINISLGYNYWADNITNPTDAQVAAAFAGQASWTEGWKNFLNGTTDIRSNFSPGSTIAILATDAVVTKAAGNDAIKSEKDPLTYVLAHDSTINPNLLIVGGLTKDGSVNAKADLYSETNVAGTDPLIQNRFLLANAYVNIAENSISVDGYLSPDSWASGTSFAAPRVAGYAAVLRQKFPNLTGANTADILLATARYDTLKCYPNCDKTIYGQGEASLSRAMSPFGALK